MTYGGVNPKDTFEDSWLGSLLLCVVKFSLIFPGRCIREFFLLLRLLIVVSMNFC